MIPDKLRPVSSGILVAILIGSLWAPVAAADHNGDDSYAVVQGDQCVPIEPITDENRTVEEFYDYRHPHVDGGNRDHPRWGRHFSSDGTVEYQQDDTSVILLYEGSAGLSFVVLHDKLHEPQENGTDGGSVTFSYSNLPEDGEWAILDDSYGQMTDEADNDDRHYIGGDAPGDYDAQSNWVYTQGRNDGAAFRGLADEDFSVTIEPAFNDDANIRYGDDRRTGEYDNPNANDGYNGTIDEWQVVTATDDGFERVSLNSLEDPVRIERGACTDMHVTSVESNETRIEAGDTVAVTATVENDGLVEGEHEATFTIEDSEIATESVTVASGEESTVEFTQRFKSPGEFTIGVDGEETTIVVEEADDGAEQATTQSTTESEAPGLGPLAAIVALIASALSIFARRER